MGILGGSDFSRIKTSLLKKFLNSTIGEQNEKSLDNIVRDINTSVRDIMPTDFEVSGDTTKSIVVLQDGVEVSVYGTTSVVIGSFTINSDEQIKIAKVTATTKYLTSVGDIYISNKYSGPTSESLLDDFGSTSLAAYARITADTVEYVEKSLTGDFIAGETYYVHMVDRSGGYCYCNKFVVEYGINDITRKEKIVNDTEVNTQASSTSVIIGSFNFKEYGNNTPVMLRMLYDLKTNYNGNMYAHVFISSQYSTPQDLSTLQADDTNVFSSKEYLILAMFYECYRSLGNKSITDTLNSDKEYYVHLISDSPGYTVYCRDFVIEYKEHITSNSIVTSNNSGILFLSGSGSVILAHPVIPEKCLVNINSQNTSVEWDLTPTKLNLTTKSGESTVWVMWQVVELN